MFRKLLIVVVWGMAWCQANAGPILVANHSFENPVTDSVAAAPSWQYVNSFDFFNMGNPFQFNSAAFPGGYYVGANPTTDPANGGPGYPGIDGRNFGYIFQQGPGAGMQQTLSAVLQPDTAYTLRVNFGARNGVLGGPTLGSLIELLAGNTVIASAQDDVGPTPGTWVTQTAHLANSDAFSGLYGQALTIRMRTTLPSVIPASASDWDNIRLDATAVPEPSAVVLVGLGGLGWFAYRRRRAARRYAQPQL